MRMEEAHNGVEAKKKLRRRKEQCGRIVIRRKTTGVSSLDPSNALFPSLALQHLVLYPIHKIKAQPAKGKRVQISKSA